MSKKLDQAIEEELEGGRLAPPWVKFPDMSRYAMGWRMGSGEWYLKMWRRWAETADVDWRAYFAAYQPIPHSWAVWPLEMLNADEDLDELEEDEIAERARALGFDIGADG